MENNKTKDRVSFGKKMFNKTVKSMTWLMLVTLLVGTFAQPGSALAEEIGSNRVEKSVDSGSAVKQETKKYKKVDKTTDKKVHTPDTESKKSVEQSTEAQPNAPNTSSEKQEVKVVETLKSNDKALDSAFKRVDELVKDYMKSHEDQASKIESVLKSKDYKKTTSVNDRLLLFGNFELSSYVIANLQNGTDYSQQEYKDVDEIDLSKLSSKIQFTVTDAKIGMAIEPDQSLFPGLKPQFDNNTQKLVYFKLSVSNLNKEPIPLNAAMFKAIDTNGKSYEINAAYTGITTDNQLVNSTDLMLTPMIGENGFSTVDIAFLVNKDINLSKLQYIYNDKAIDIDLDKSMVNDAKRSLTEADAAMPTSTTVRALAEDGIAIDVNISGAVNGHNGQQTHLWQLVDSNGQEVFCMDPGLAATATPMTGHWVNIAEAINKYPSLTAAKVQVLNVKLQLLKALGFDPNQSGDKGSIGATVFQALTWEATQGATVTSTDGSFNTLMGQLTLFYNMYTLMPTNNFRVIGDLGYKIGVGGEKGTAGLDFQANSAMMVPNKNLSWTNYYWSALDNTADDPKVTTLGLYSYIPIGNIMHKYGPTEVATMLQHFHGMSDSQRNPLSKQIKSAYQYHYIIPKSKGGSLNTFTNEDLSYGDTIFDISDLKNIKLKDPAAFAKLGIKEWMIFSSSYNKQQLLAMKGDILGEIYAFMTDDSKYQNFLQVTGEPYMYSVTPGFDVYSYFSLDTEKTVQLNGQEFTIPELEDLDIDITETHVGLYKDGKLVQWDDDSVFTDDFKIKEGSYVVNGQLTDSKPSSGDAIFAFSKDGKLKLRNIIWGKYELKEVQWPTGTENRPKDTITLDPDKDATGEDDDLGVPLITLEGQDGFTNTLIAFGFEAQKTVVMTGSQQEGLLATVGKDTQFTSGTHQSIINEKVDLSKAVFELQYADGTPVKTTDTMMKLFDPSKDLVKGTVVQHENVRFSPTKEGFLEVHHLVANDNETMKLVEVETPDRTNLDKKVITIQITSAPLYGQQPWQDEHYDSTSAMGATNGFLNNIDYTGVRLVKDINYLGTIVSNQAGTAYNPMDHSIGLSDFKGAQYTLFYGDGPKKDTPVNKSDYVAELIKYGAWNGATTTVSASGPIVFDVQPNGLVAILDNLIFGSYYLLETKAAPGLHLDKVKYYFGDEPASLGENEKYLEPTIKNANGNGIGATDSGSTNVSASKESKGVTVDDVKLVSVELEKRTKYLQTDSPFQTSETPSWSTGSKDVTYNHGDINIHYVNDKNLFGESQVNDLGSTRRNQAIYGLFYYTDTIDGQGKKGQPVKLTDKVVEHLKVVNGTQVDKDYETTTGVKINGTTDVVIQLGEDARLKLEDIANGDYYLKELEAPAGLAIDPKEYIFGFNLVDRPTYVGNGTDNILNKPESQTQDKISTVDTTHNYHFDNTFDNGKFGSTDVLLTFGFSSAKTFDSTASENGTVGENGVTMKLSPIDGTLGDPITTVTKKETLKDPSGKLVTMNGFYEFRTVPIGTWLLTSESNNPELLEIDPIIVRMFREDDGDYTLEFYTDVDHKGTLEDNPGAVLLTRYTIKEGDPIPTQGQLDQLASNDEIKDGYGPGKNGADVDEGEDHVWQRPDNKDVDKDPSKNHNFISAEVNMDYAGFETIDKIEPDDKEKEIGTTAYNEVDGGKFVNADKDQTIIDIIDLSKYTSKTNGEIVTVEAAIPTIPYTNGIVENEKDPISIDGLKNEDITEPTVVLDSKGNKAIALPSKKVEVIRTEDQEKEGLKDNQFVFNKGMKEVKVKVSGIDLTQFKPGQKVVMFEKLVDTKLVPAIHADINSESQTVIVKPSIGTQFFVANNGNVDLANIKDEDLLLGNTYMPGAKIKVIDYVKVTGAKVGVPTKFVARLHTKDADGNIVPVLDGKTGQPIVGESEIITPTKSNFIVPVYLEFVAPKDVDKIVAFEQGYEQNKETEEFEENEDLVHEDIDDEGQTIVPKQPEIRTKAQVNGDNVFTPSKETPMHDDIQVTNAAQNAELEMKIKLWRRTPDGKGGYKDEVVFESAQDIVIATDDEKYAISTIVDTSKDVDGTLYVWTEELHDKEAGLLAEHNDLNNKDQTVRVKNPKTPKTPTKKPGNGFADTGSKVLGWAVVAGIVIIVAAYFLVRKKKETDVDK